MWRHTVVKEACVSFRPEFTSKSLKLPVISAGVVQWQYWSLPSFGPRFDSPQVTATLKTYSAKSDTADDFDLIKAAAGIMWPSASQERDSTK